MKAPREYGRREVRAGPAGAATSAAQPAGSVAPAAARVTIKSLKYSQDTIQITKGETVECVNDDLTPHTVTSDTGGELNSGSLDVGTTLAPHIQSARYICVLLHIPSGDEGQRRRKIDGN